MRYESDRRVQVWVARTGSDTRGFGSGYLVAPRLVLTAAHVVDDVSGTGRGAVQVSRPDSGGGNFPATVRWWRRDELVDAALVEVDDGRGWQVPESFGDLALRPPQRWGRLIGTGPHEVTVVGFPRMQKDPGDGRRLDESLAGRIVPGTGSLAGRYEITSGQPVPGTGPDRWAGMSGAAVLSGDRYGDVMLCGVTRRDRQADGGVRLTATPVAHLVADGRFRALVTKHARWEPVLEPTEPAALLTPAAPERLLHSPAALLRADAEAVTFHGRQKEQADLRVWCEQGPAAVSVRVVTGPGGQGKTRLARRLTDDLSREGWATGHLRTDLTDYGSPPDFAPLLTALPLLLVVDYAETRPRLLRELISQLCRSRHRVRILLLARSDGEWRTDALSAAPATRSLLKAAPVTELTPLIPDHRPPGDRLTAFTQAARDLARLLPHVPSVPAHDWSALAATLQPHEDLSHTRYDNALTLQLAALVTLLQHGPAPVDTNPGEPLEQILLDHEERFWEDSAKTPAFKADLRTPVLGAAVAVAALCGAASKDQALRVISEVPDLPSDMAPPAVAWLAALYPAARGRYWGSLQPDRIAEYLTSRTVMDERVRLPALLTAASPEQQAQLLTVLARAAVAHYNAGRATESEHVLGAVDTALNTVPLAHQAVRTVEAALPYPSHVIAGLALRLTGALVQANERLALIQVNQRGLAEDSVHESELAASLINFSNRLAEAGRRTDSLVAAEEAVVICRRLAAADPAAHELDLAGSLSNLGLRLSEAGRKTEGLAATEEAVAIDRRLAAANPAAHEPHLAAALNNLGTWLSQVGRKTKGLAAAEEAVAICRRLAAANPTAHEPHLARSLSNLGLRLSEAGRRTEGLAAAEEAVTVFRRLAASNPAAHEPDFAFLLGHFGVLLSEAGRRAEGLAAAEEAVAICRRLAAANPTAHEPHLALSLTSLGTLLMDAGRRTDALRAGQQAVEIRRRLAADDPAAFEADLAAALTNLGAQLTLTGRGAEGLAAAEEAVDRYRRLAADHPAAHEPHLAHSLTNLSTHLSSTGRWTEALDAVQQAVQIRRRLAEDEPTAFEPDLAHSLSNLGLRLAKAGRWAEGLAATEEAIVIYRRLAAADPAAFEPDLAGALSNLGNRLAEAGRRSDALAAAEEAVVVYRRLAADDPAAFEPDLAGALSNLGNRLAEAGRWDEGLNAERQAVKIRRRLVVDNPAAFEPDLALSLSNLGNRLAEVGQRAEGLAATEEAVVIYRRLAADDPPAFAPGLARALSNLGIPLAEAGRWDDGLAAEAEAVALYRELSIYQPAAFEPELARSLLAAALLLVAEGDLPEALLATGQAVELYRSHVAAKPSVLPRLHAVLTLQANILDDLGREQEAQEIRRWLMTNAAQPDS
ncbi:tetratricopeptide repeat protein [Streptomyces sp. NPDC052687]|uniref:tetratricopeptide repeat protein n=1 Tax=Streptomyces sp. NPDC052687 TaxID=3154759 RepID=UPI003449E57B